MNSESPNDKEWINTLSLMDNICMEYRGVIVHQMVFIETGIELFISAFLSGNDKMRRDDLMALLTYKDGIISNHGKMVILTYILNTYFREFIKEHPNYLRNLNDAIAMRNTVAHRKMYANPARISEFDGETIELSWTTTSKGELKKGQLLLNSTKIKKFEVRMMKIREQTNLLIDLVDQSGPTE